MTLSSNDIDNIDIDSNKIMIDCFNQNNQKCIITLGPVTALKLLISDINDVVDTNVKVDVGGSAHYEEMLLVDGCVVFPKHAIRLNCVDSDRLYECCKKFLTHVIDKL